MPQTVLITGATGFAGSFLVEHYLKRGWRVHGTYRDPPDELSMATGGAVLHGIELVDAPSVNRLVQAVQPNLVLHLAAQSSVSASHRDPNETMAINSGSQRNLLEAIRVNRPSARVLVVGSCDEYGDVGVERNPVSESEELRPINPYALSKVVQDLMGYEYFKVHDLRVMRVRPFLQLGPRRQAQFAAGSFARQIAEIERGAREAVLEVGNVDLARDFTDVRDVVTAYALVAEQGMPGEVYNIASGEPHTLRAMIEAMLNAAGVSAEIRRVPWLEREGETPLLVGDARKLHRATGWAPTISFEQSAADTVAYWRDRLSTELVPEGERA